MFSGLFHYDNPFWRFIGKLGDLIILNVLWIICSIPIVTIGASTTAVYYVTLKLVRDEEGGTIQSFFRSFKENFKQSTIIWLMLLAAGIILAIDLQFVSYYSGMSGVITLVMRSVFGCFVFIYACAIVYIFAIQAKFYNPVKRTFLNAFFMAVRHFPKTLLMVVGNTVIVIVCVFFVPQLMILPLVFGLPLFAFINSYLLVGIFDVYIPNPEEESGSELEQEP